MTRVGETIPHHALRRLRRPELPMDTVELARYLVGKVAVHDTDDGRLSGRIVETEAYPVGDSAGHAFRGETRRNASLFLGTGHAYVYFAYGLSFMLNVTSEAAGAGAGVLLRALEPLDGIDRMRRFRGGAGLLDLARRPGRLTQAMRIDFRLDGSGFGRPRSTLARGEPAEKRRDRPKCTHRFDAQRGLQTALLRARQPVRERSKEVERIVRQNLANWRHNRRSTSISPDGLKQQISELPAVGASRDRADSRPSPDQSTVAGIEGG